MSKISGDELEQLRQAFPITAYLEARGVSLIRKGTQQACKCPLGGHDDKTESFFVSPAKRRYKCFGCERSGDIIQLVMELEHVDFREAVESLRAKPVSVGPSSPVPPPDVVLSHERRVALLTRVSEVYHQAALERSEFREYLKRRGLDSGELVEAFHLGYSNRNLSKILPQRHAAAGVKIRQELRALGLLRESGHETFSGFLFVPFRDADGAIVYGYGRRIGSGTAGSPDHLYLRGPQRGFLSSNVFRASDVVLLSEAVLDAFTWWVHGYRQIAASFGADGVTDELFEQLVRMKHVVLCQDNDAAGERAAKDVAQRLIGQSASIGCWRVTLPDGIKDINEFGLIATPGPRSLGMLLRQMRWMGTGAGPDRPTLASAIEARPLDVPSLRIPPDRSEGSLDEGSLDKGSLGENSLDEGSLEGGDPKADESVNVDRKTTPPLIAPPQSAARPHTQTDARALPASTQSPPEPAVIPLLPKVDIPSTIDGENLWLRLEPVHYRVRGLQMSSSPLKTNQAMRKVSLLATRDGAVHASKLDLGDAKERATFAKQASTELAIDEDLLKRQLGLVMLKVEELQESLGKQGARTDTNKRYEMSPEEEQQARAFLADDNNIDLIIQHMGMCGYVGEDINKLIGYFVIVSRKRDKPLGLVIVGSSGIGKTQLMSALLLFVPPEDVKKPSLVTERSLFYFGEYELAGKVLAIAEEEGAEKAVYPVKILQSEQELNIFSTKSDALTGEPVSFERRVSGPTAVLFTSTSTVGNDELLNRCFVLSVDESRTQTGAIFAAQREAETLAGLRAKWQREQILRLHHNAQRLLRRVEVVNPYAPQLTFSDHETTARRDHARYLALISTIAFWRQAQKPILTERIGGRVVELIEVDVKDVEVANRIMSHVEGRSLGDLLPHTRQFLLRLHALVNERAEREGIEREQVYFTRREMREATGYGSTQVHQHLHRLQDLEYVLARPYNGQIYYQLLYNGEGQDGSRFALGLIDPKGLSSPTQGNADGYRLPAKNSDPSDLNSARFRGPFGPDSGVDRTPELDGNESDVDELDGSMIAMGPQGAVGGLWAGGNGHTVNGRHAGDEA